MSKRFDFVNGDRRNACMQGSTFQSGVYIRDKYNNPIDLTGYSFRMQVRETVDAASTLLEITNSSYGTITASQGKISWTVPAAVTAAIAAGNYVYDLEIVSGGSIVTRVIEGKFDVTAEVTR